MTKSNIVSHTHKQLIQTQTVYFHFIFILFDQNKKKHWLNTSPLRIIWRILVFRTVIKIELYPLIKQAHFS